MTMGEVATIERSRKPALTTGNPVSAMVPNSVESAWRLAEIIAASGMAPKAYGADPHKIMTGMLAGMEIGLTPFAALQSIAVINGNPSLWGDGALALVLASNLVEDMDESDDGETATCTIKRVGRATPIVRMFSNDDAAKAGLKGKAGPWTQYPARMRQMRARAFALRDGFPDVLKGLRVAEETQDYADFADATPRPAVGVSVPLTGAALLEQAEPSPAASLPEAAVDTPQPSAEQPSGAAPTEGASKAAEWVESFIAKVNDAPDREALMAVQLKGEKALAKLDENEPTLYALAVAAIKTRLAELDVADAGDEFGDLPGEHEVLA
jgi:hypothetical protein